ncbi:MAG: hypothetical protein V5B40_14500 [Candidatus Accumulibacter meliphilus]|uniref:hypothetical protein n=1 Tax=Candidatus Accumulibacter meliphilus TaxID=2211374 RepID=UPI002FC2C98F
MTQFAVGPDRERYTDSGRVEVDVGSGMVIAVERRASLHRIVVAGEAAGEDDEMPTDNDETRMLDLQRVVQAQKTLGAAS